MTFVDEAKICQGKRQPPITLGGCLPWKFNLAYCFIALLSLWQ